jgi:cation diffusion facilitator CzcD-associated flavoprotein CzcO
MDDTVDVAIVGAGPYGLSLAAHLRAAGVSFRHFGYPMRLWRESMPAGLYLKSQGFASNLSDPQGSHTLGAFCRQAGYDYADYGLPVPLSTFVAYGDWFAAQRAPDLEQTHVTGVRRSGHAYELDLATGERADARAVVVAIGVEAFARRPEALAGLPESACTHSDAYNDLATLAGQDVIVVGAGQSALETATLAHESGAQVRLLARAGRINWNSRPLPEKRGAYRRFREPEAGLGSGWATRFYSNAPGAFRRLPAGTRARLARTALGPAGAHWLRPRFEGTVPALLSHRLDWAETSGAGMRLGVTVAGEEERALSADHVIAATGYRPELARLSFLDPSLRATVATLDDAPAVDASYESSAPGLYFMGAAVASSFGPVVRFVYGADHAARSVTRRLAAQRRRRPVVTAAPAEVSEGAR